jgi:hypothetical protein
MVALRPANYWLMGSPIEDRSTFFGPFPPNRQGVHSSRTAVRYYLEMVVYVVAAIRMRKREILERKTNASIAAPTLFLT